MKTLLSIDIGTKNLHFVEGSYYKGDLVVQKAKSFEIPEGYLKEESIENPILLAEIIGSAIKNSDFKATEVVITINACSAIVRDIDLPTAKPKELDSMIKNELYQTFHVPSTDVIQYKFIEKVVNENGITLNRYRVVAIDGNLIESYHNLMEIAKIKTIAMDMNLNAIEKLFSGDVIINDRPLVGESVMLMDFGHTFTTLYIIAKGRPIFYRHINMGSREIEKIISDGTFTPISEVLKLKETGQSFFNESGGASQKNYDLLKPFFYGLNDEIRKIISFYSSRPGSSRVERVYLFGQGSELAGLPDYWESNLNIPVEKIKSISKVTISNAEPLLPAHLNAIGALIRY